MKSFILFLTFFLFSFSSSLKNNFIEIQTPTSIIIGKKIEIKINNQKIININEFTGIRYGSAKRFEKSTPEWLMKSGNGRYKINATKLSNYCPQQYGFIDMFDSELNDDNFDRKLIKNRMNENCLQLNIWTIINDNNLELKPVFVWFHGGSFISDTITRLLYQGKYLAAMENIVVVTINYRLDAFGFLNIQNNDDNDDNDENKIKIQTNAGIWDQLLALEWIQEHIEYFNGDPKRITIAGFDSGATSVGLHLLSPRSRKLFQQVLMMSGSIYTQLISQRSICNQEISKMWIEMAKNISCQQSSTKSIIKCLKKQSMDKILLMINPIGSISTGPEIIMNKNDELFPFDTLNEAIENIEKSSLSIMIGSTDDEGSQILPMMNDKLLFQFNQQQQLSFNEMQKQIQKLTTKLVQPRGCCNKINGMEISDYYLNKLNDTTLTYKTIGQCLGDYYVSCPLILFAEKLLQNKNSMIKLYQYVWSQKTLATNRYIPCLDWMGTCHGMDVLMLFGIPFQRPQEFNDLDRKNSKKFMHTIGHFVKFGKPNGNNDWLPWTLEHRPYSKFSNNKWQNLNLKNWKFKQCKNVWEKYLMTTDDNDVDNDLNLCRR